MQKVAIFLPGIMGSVLRSRGAAPVNLWTKDAHEIYSTLINNPNVLRYSGTAADAYEVIDVANVWGIYHTPFCAKLISNLKKRPDFSKAGAVFSFAYDWRQSTPQILED